MEHPAGDVLQRFAALQGTRAENRQVVQHLLARCPECAARLRAAWKPEPDEAEYDAALVRVFARILKPRSRKGAWQTLLAPASSSSAAGRPARCGELD